MWELLVQGDSPELYFKFFWLCLSALLLLGHTVQTPSPFFVWTPSPIFVWTPSPIFCGYVKNHGARRLFFFTLLDFSLGYYWLKYGRLSR